MYSHNVMTLTGIVVYIAVYLSLKCERHADI